MRERTVKDTPFRGKLSRRQIREAVEKVISERKARCIEYTKEILKSQWLCGMGTLSVNIYIGH